MSSASSASSATTAWPASYLAVLGAADAAEAARKMVAAAHDPELDAFGAASCRIWDDGRAACCAGPAAAAGPHPLLLPLPPGRYGPFPAKEGSATYACVAAGSAGRLLDALRVSAADGRAALDALVAALDSPELARREGDHVYQVWQDGEITLQKCGRLLNRRSLHTVAPPMPARHPMPRGDPRSNSYAYVTEEGALLIRAALATVARVPDPFGAAGELAARARRGPEAGPEAAVARIAACLQRAAGE